MDILWTGFLFGLLGSAHCAGMCGPIAVALPGSDRNGMALFSGRLLYNTGRTLTYMLMGVAAGLLGLGAALAGYQGGLSVFAGTVILLMLIFRTRFFSTSTVFRSEYFRSLFGRLLKSPGNGSLFSLGILNGFLPCGLVYLALAGSAAAGSLLNSVLYMGLFGLGTIPMMLALSLAPGWLKPEARRRLTKFIPVGAALVAVLLILRGLSLGIPFISPDLTGAGAEMCH
jgi:uncharacterized protein